MIRTGSTIIRHALNVLVALIFSALWLPAVAEESQVIEEIVVTAQKREQALMDVPMSVSAITAEEIKAMGATDIRDIQSSVPSFQIAGVGATQTFQLRGVSPAGSLLPSVGRYVDGMAINTEAAGYGVNVPLIDMQQVEVLKGPQGTLWGEGSLGGTVIYKTQNPTMDGETDGFFEVSARDVADGNSGYRVTLAGDVIDTENFGLRLAGFYRQKAGWVDSLQQGDDYNDGERMMIRAKAVWDVSDSFSASLMWQHYEFEQDGLEYSAIDGGPSTFILSEAIDDEYDMFNLILEWDLGDINITSSTGYIDREYVSPFDLPGFAAVTEFYFPGSTFLAPVFGNPQSVTTPITSIPYNLWNETETFSQEIRVSGTTGDNFFWTVGAFYKDSEFFAPAETEWYPDPNTLPITALEGQLFNQTQALAFFAEGTYAFNDKVELTVGARRYDDDRDAKHVTTIFGGPTSITENVENDDTVYRLVLKYNIDADNMAYVSASEGFRSGGTQFIDSGGLFPNTFDPEELVTYEIGAKGVLADGDLLYEVALYSTEYENIQVYTPNPLGVQAFLNGGEVDMIGVEIAAQYNVSEDLFFKMSYSNNDSEFQQDTLTHLKGETMDNVPENIWSLAADYRFNWTDSIGGHFRLDYFHSDGTEIHLRGFGYLNDTAITEDQKTLNVRIGADFNGWSAYLFAENLTDEDAANAVPWATLTEYIYQQPRTVGITVRTSF